MKIEMSNRELFEIIERAVNGDIKSKFEILILFDPLIRNESYVNRKFSQDCKEYIEDRLFDSIEKFKKIKDIKKLL